MRLVLEDDDGKVVEVWTNENLKIADYLKRSGGIVTGEVEFQHPMFVKAVPGSGVEIAMGSKNKGFGLDEGGIPAFYYNGVKLFNIADLFGTHNFNPSEKYNTSGGTINGNATVTGTLSVKDKVRCDGGLVINGWEINING